MAFFQIGEILIFKEIKAYGLFLILNLAVLALSQLFMNGKIIVNKKE
jgi:hypothetical protein